MSEYYVNSLVFEINGRSHRYEIQADSLEESTRQAHERALADGWQPPPLRQHWWQFWRPESYPGWLSDLLAKTFDSAGDGGDDAKS